MEFDFTKIKPPHGLLVLKLIATCAVGFLAIYQANPVLFEKLDFLKLLFLAIAGPMSLCSILSLTNYFMRHTKSDEGGAIMSIYIGSIATDTNIGIAIAFHHFFPNTDLITILILGSIGAVILIGIISFFL